MFALKLVVTSVKPVPSTCQIRCLSQSSTKYKETVDEMMRIWQINSYAKVPPFELSRVKIPTIKRSNDVLIKVQAASVNPIDLAVCQGYGATLWNVMRKMKGSKENFKENTEFPLTVGRDFAGVVVSKGQNVGDRLNSGDKVWGVVPIEQRGCNAEYVITDSNLVNPRPESLSHVEASSILYTGLTAWSALWLTGGLEGKINNPKYLNKKVLVLGGSGGVGTSAIQLLKAWNMQVVTTCNANAVKFLESLGVDAVDYEDQNADSIVAKGGPYEIILDCANQGIDSVKAKGYPHKTYIGLNSPILKNFDESGLLGGGIKNLGVMIKSNMPWNKTAVKWAFFTASPTGINMIQKFVEEGKIQPVVEQVYQFEELPEAYQRIAKGHLRGKIIVEMK